MLSDAPGTLEGEGVQDAARLIRWCWWSGVKGAAEMQHDYQSPPEMTPIQTEQGRFNRRVQSRQTYLGFLKSCSNIGGIRS